MRSNTPLVVPGLPWWRSAATCSAIRSSSVMTAPASPIAPSVFDGKNDSTPPAPSSPAWRPSQRMPIASALSSTMVTSWRRAMSRTAARSASWQNRCTGMTNRVRGVTAAAKAAGSIA